MYVISAQRSREEEWHWNFHCKRERGKMTETECREATRRGEKNFLPLHAHTCTCVQKREQDKESAEEKKGEQSGREGEHTSPRIKNFSLRERERERVACLSL